MKKAVDRLSRVWYWKGAAWYQKEVTIPGHWAGKKCKASARKDQRYLCLAG